MCNESQIEVVTHGGLTGLSQGAIANTEQLALSTELMTEIEEIDPYGRTLTTQSGVKLQTIQEVSEQHNICLLYTSPSPRDQRGSSMRGYG